MIVRLNGVMQNFPVTAGFGTLDAVHLVPHTGIDLAMPVGTDIISPVDGVISRIADFGNESLGKAVFLRIKGGKELVFGHLSDINVKSGQVIHVGDKLAESGNTGFSTGAHLHLALKDSHGNFIDPQSYEHIMQNHDIALAKVPSVADLLNPFKELPKPSMSMTNPFKEFMDFFNPIVRFFSWCGGVADNIKAEGFWDWLELRLELGLKFVFTGILHLNDLLFLMPAILFMVFYFAVGKNKTTKWILPLWFIYFLSTVLSIYLDNN